MNDTVNAKATIADQIHRAVSSLLDTELRLNADLAAARTSITQLEDEIGLLRRQLTVEADTRKRLEEIVTEVAKLVNP